MDNGSVIAAPLTTAKLSDQTEITGDYTKKSAHGLATALQHGQLAVRLEVVGVRPER